MAQTIDNLSVTWNNAGTTFTALKLAVTDTASNASSLLMDLQVGGSSKFKVTKGGRIDFPAVSTVSAVQISYGYANYGLVFTGDLGGHSTVNVVAGKAKQALGFSALQIASDIPFAFAQSDSATDTADTILRRDAANTLAQRNSTNAQTFRLYNTYTDASNYERGFLTWDTNVLKIGTEKAGTGSARNLELQTDGTTRIAVTSGGNLYSLALETRFYITNTASYISTLAGRFSSLGLVMEDGYQIGWRARSRISSASDGVLALTDYAGTTFNRLQFGGTTSSFPALKRSTTALQVRLADDSAFTTIESSAVNAYATYTSDTNYQRCGIKTAKTTLSNVSGASVTASSLIPAGAFLIGVTSRVNTALGTGNGTTGYQVGTAGDPDLWGAITGTAEGTASGSANYTAPGASGLFTEATNVIVTAVGGNFDATGVIELAIHYLLTEAD